VPSAGQYDVAYKMSVSSPEPVSVAGMTSHCVLTKLLYSRLSMHSMVLVSAVVRCYLHGSGGQYIVLTLQLRLEHHMKHKRSARCSRDLTVVSEHSSSVQLAVY
jgi:hypothetical protein